MSYKEESFKVAQLRDKQKWAKDSYKRLSKKLECLLESRDHTSDDAKKFDLENQIKNLNDELEGIGKEIQKFEELIEKAQKGESVVDETDAEQDNNTQSHDSEFDELTRDRNRARNENADSKGEIQIVDSQSLFRKGEPIENALIYVATFFPDLTPYEFNQVVSSLVRDRTIKIETDSQVITDKGKVRTIKTEAVKSLSSIWEESLSEPDTYLKKCHLKSVETGKSRVIDFDIPNLRNEMKSYLKGEQPLYLDNLLEKTQLFMFHPYVQVAKGGIDILVDAMLTHPTIYNEDWIFQLIQELTNKEDWTIDPNLDLEKQVYKFLEELEASKRREVVFTRIASLLYFMLNEDCLKLTVKRFLGRLMSHERYDAVISIINDLENVDGFNGFYWIKQLLDNGDEDTRMKAYKLLYRKLKMSGFRIYEQLEKLQTWLPEKDRDSSKYSHSNRAALSVLIDYCSDTISKLPEKDYGSYPSKYPLFRPFQKSEIEKKFHIILDWLFRRSPDDTFAIESILKDDVDAISFLGSLIAEWFIILSGLDDEIPSESLVAIEVMLQQIVACSSKAQQKGLSQFWADFAEYLLIRINQQSDGGSSEMRKYKKRVTRRRNLIRKLSKQFKSLQQVA